MQALIDKIKSKNTLTLIFILMLVTTIPLGIYLVSHQQIFKGKATVKSKLSIQTAWQKPGTMEFIEAAKPVVVKLLGGYERAGEIKQKSPGTFIIGRIWEPDQPVNGNPEDRAQEWFNRNNGVLNSPGIDCWEGYNEPPTNHTDEIANMQWYSRHEIKRMQLLESIGKKGCIGNFSVGNPDFPLWPYFRDAISYASSNGHYLGLHEYGPTSMSDRADYFSLRHRIVYRDNGFSLPLIISETGIDENGNQDSGGWRAHTTAGDYFDQLKWYDDRLQEDSYVKGTTIFSYGLYGWNSFEIYPELVGSDGRSGPLPAYIGGGPPPSGPITPPASCQIGYQLPDMTDPCFSCITTQAPGLVGAIKNLNPPLFSGCSDKETLKYWCNGGISQEATSQCQGYKSGVCASSCIGTVSPTPTPTPTLKPNTTPAKTPTPTLGFIWPTLTPTFPPEPTSPPTLTPTKIPSPTRTPTPKPPTPTTITPTPTPTPTPATIQYDLNSDSKINSLDVAVLLGAWRKQTPENIAKVDFNRDKVINAVDYSLLVRNLSQ